MIIELHHNDRKSEFREISCLELTAPLVLFDSDTGKFFVKTPCDPRICETAPKYLLYRECRGQVLGNIEIVQQKSTEVMA